MFSYFDQRWLIINNNKKNDMFTYLYFSKLAPLQSNNFELGRSWLGWAKHLTSN